jgi:hypothetical protein
VKRFERLEQIRRMDPEKDALEIYRLASAYEFPWDFTRALELALYRTYAVPSIGRLLAETAELTDRPQKRYDDTTLLLDAVVEHGFDSEQGRTAVRRINQMHRGYDISNDDMRYVLCTFVVMPRRWIDTYGWRRLSRHEVIASAVHYQTLGRRMGIKDVPGSYEEFEACLDAYEEANFAWDSEARRVSDATLALMGRPGIRAPSRLSCAPRRLPCSTSLFCGPSATGLRTRSPVTSSAERSACADVPSGCCRPAGHRTTRGRTGRSKATRTATGWTSSALARSRACGAARCATPDRQRSTPPSEARVSRSQVSSAREVARAMVRIPRRKGSSSSSARNGRSPS